MLLKIKKSASPQQNEQRASMMRVLQASRVALVSAIVIPICWVLLLFNFDPRTLFGVDIIRRFLTWLLYVVVLIILGRQPRSVHPTHERKASAPKIVVGGLVAGARASTPQNQNRGAITVLISKQQTEAQDRDRDGATVAASQIEFVSQTAAANANASIHSANVATSTLGERKHSVPLKIVAKKSSMWSVSGRALTALPGAADSEGRPASTASGQTHASEQNGW